MLIYAPAFDPTHCVVRLASVAVHYPGETLLFDQLRLLDFYLLYPTCLADVRLKTEHRSAKRKLRSEITRYNHPDDPLVAFQTLGSFAFEAARFLVANNIFSRDEWASGQIDLARDRLPPELSEVVSMYVKRKDWVFDLVVRQLSDIPFFGIDGLKHRSGLLEYRYDAL